MLPQLFRVARAALGDSLECLAAGVPLAFRATW